MTHQCVRVIRLPFDEMVMIIHQNVEEPEADAYITVGNDLGPLLVKRVSALVAHQCVTGGGYVDPDGAEPERPREGEADSDAGALLCLR